MEMLLCALLFVYFCFPFFSFIHHYHGITIFVLRSRRRMRPNTNYVVIIMAIINIINIIEATQKIKSPQLPIHIWPGPHGVCFTNKTQAMAKRATLDGI